MLRLEIGYLLADTVVLLALRMRTRRNKLDPFLLVHHVVLASALPYLLSIRKGDFYVAAMFLMNASTPLLHARYAVGKSKWSGGAVHRALTVTLLCVFVACRIVLWPVLFCIQARQATQFESETGTSAGCPRWYCFAAAAAFVGMNGTWAWKLLRQSMRKHAEFGTRSRVQGGETEMKSS